LKLSLKIFTNKILCVAVVTTLTILLSGMYRTAIAVTTCNTTDYEAFVVSPIDGKTTYAITKNAMTWASAKALAEANGAKLLESVSKEINDTIQAAFATYFTAAPAPSSGTKAWIGLYDPVGVRIFTYENDTAPVKTCAEGFTYVSDRNRCEKALDCSSGTYASGKCVIPSVVSCASGYTSNETNSQCEADPICTGTGNTYDPSKKKCVNTLQVETNPTCAGSGAFDSTIDKCKLSYTNTCSGTSVFNTEMNACVSEPACNNGTADMTNNVCWSAVSISCAGGATYNSETGQCSSTSTSSPSSDRFSWVSGAGITYTNWQPGQPDNYCTNADLSANADKMCPGENWAAINNDGKWTDEGNHSTGAVQLKAVTEWTNNTLDCVKATTPATDKPVIDLPSDAGQKWCKDTFNLNLAQCVKTTDSQDFCPLEKQACSTVWADPTCPTGSTLNSTRHMCQADAVSTTCPTGYTWDAAVDKCVKTPECPDGGTLNAVRGMCEKVKSNGCPTGYTMDTDNNVCYKATACGGSTEPITCSDNSYTYNSTSKMCEKSPACSVGSYNSTYDKCILPVTKGCPTGYAYNSTRNQCEKTAECAEGATYNSATLKCEGGGSYAATLSGGVNYNIPVYTDFYAISEIYTTANFGYSGCPSNAISCWYDDGAGQENGGGYVATWISGYRAVIGYIASNANVKLYNQGGQIVTNSSYCTSSYCTATDAFDNCVSFECTSATTNTLLGSMSSSAFSGSKPVYSQNTLTFSSSYCTSSYCTATDAFDNCVSSECMSYASNPLIGYIATSPGTYGGTYSCPSGGTLSGTTCNNSTSANPTCSNGTWDSSIGMCKATYTNECSTGSTYDNAVSACIGTPDCTSGALNTAADICQLGASGGVLGEGEGGYYNTLTDRCELPLGCPSGYTYNSTSKRCEKAVGCPVGATLNSSTGKCQADLTYTCPDSTYSYNTGTKRCEKLPVCAVGTYSTTHDKCILPVTKGCPSGYTYNSTRNQCEKTAECATGTTYNAATLKCESGGSYAATGTTISFNVKVGGWFEYMTDDIHFLRLGEPNCEQAIYDDNGTYLGCASPWETAYLTTQSFPGAVPVYNLCGALSFATTTQMCGTIGATYYVSSTYNAAIGATTGIYRASTYQGADLIAFGGGQAYASPSPVSATTYTCPSGGTLSGATCSTLTQANPTCANGTWDSSIGMCKAAYTNECATGSTYDSIVSACISTAECKNGTLDNSADVCQQVGNGGCNTGTIYDSGVCTADPACSNGQYDQAASICFATISACPAGTTFDNTYGICYSSAVCNLGSFNATRDRCEAVFVPACVSPYLTSSTGDLCETVPPCSSDLPALPAAYSQGINMCASDALHTCHDGLTWIGLGINKCEAIPICTGGGKFDSASNSCQAGQCPATGGGGCYAIKDDTTLDANGKQMLWCSPNSCTDNTSAMMASSDAPPMGCNDVKEDGAKAPDGTCLGQLYIFNGKDMRCTKSDIRGVIGSAAKLVASIVLSVVGVGAILMAAVGITAAISSAAVNAVVNAIATSIVTSAVSIAIDAATTGISPGWAMSMATSAATAAIGAYSSGLVNGFGTSTTSTIGGTTYTSTTERVGDASAESLAKAGLQGAERVDVSGLGNLGGEVGSGTVTQYATQTAKMGSGLESIGLSETFHYVRDLSTNSLIKVTTQAAVAAPGQAYLYAQQYAAQVAPAVASGFFSSYQAKKCCYPDKISASCSKSENEEWSLASKGNCVIVGEYCDTKFLWMCMATKQVSCCFNSKFARILHQQGRPQLKAFAGMVGVKDYYGGYNVGVFGSTKAPNCRGFTPDEFQMLDFSQIDLSEYIADIDKQTNALTQPMKDYMNTISNAGSSKASVLTPAGE